MSKLTEIFAHKASEVEAAKQATAQRELIAQLADAPPVRPFRKALLAKAEATHDLGLIAEVKQASPSAGSIRPNLDPVAVAQAYEAAGADALSVLTDVRYFQGSPENLRRARAATKLPILRKDFILDSYQLMEARLWGADAVLLIVAGLTDDQLSFLYEEAKNLGLDVLVEVHTDEECEHAMKLSPNMIGVNNRNLATFETDLAFSDRILPQLDESILGISESALRTRADLNRVKAAGARAVLIGTTFCAEPDIQAKVHEVLGR